MTMAVAAHPRRRVDGHVGTLTAIGLLAGLFALCHPYIGIRGDATIYVMRALADLDPAGLGRDLMVVDDGQMRFSLFPLMLRPLVGALGAAHAAMLVAGIGSAAWLCALCALAWRLAPGRTAWAMAAMVAVLPLGYGDYNIFNFAETSATPRPLAEAAVMGALAAMLARRPIPAALALVFAGLIHPIMALAGLGTIALVLAWRLPQPWRLALAVAAVAAVAGVATLGLLGMAPFDRLLARPDAAWLDLLRTRSPHLFPTLWTSDAIPPLLAQATAIIIAAHRAAPPQRHLLVAALVVCAGGLAAESMLGDTLHLLPFIQTQAWRTTWLVAVLGGCALAFCTATLWSDGPRGRITLALVVLAWFFPPTPAVTLAAAAAALALDFGAPIRIRPTDSHAAVALLVAGVLSLCWATGPAVGYASFLRELQPGDVPSTLDPLRNNLHSLPLCLAIAAWLVAPALFEGVAAMALPLGGLLLAFGALAWDQRGTAQAFLESPHPPAVLADVEAGRNPEVFWVDSNADAWFALRRPQFFSPQQGVSIVFSRPLAREWTRRADALVALGLVPRNVYTPRNPAADDDRERVTQVAVDTLCARRDAPGLVVFPRSAGAPSLRGMIDWPLPAPLFKPRTFVSGTERRRVDGFGIVPCGAPILPR